MKVPISLPSLALLLSLATAPVWSVQLWDSPTDLPETIPQECRNALSKNITCPQLVPASKVTNQVLYSKADLTELCTTTCANSLNAFQQNVHDSCGDATLSYGSVNTTGARLTDPLLWAYNVTCLQDLYVWASNNEVCELTIEKKGILQFSDVQHILHPVGCML